MSPARACRNIHPALKTLVPPIAGVMSAFRIAFGESAKYTVKTSLIASLQHEVCVRRCSRQRFVRFDSRTERACSLRDFVGPWCGVRVTRAM